MERLLTEFSRLIVQNRNSRDKRSGRENDAAVPTNGSIGCPAEAGTEGGGASPAAFKNLDGEPCDPFTIDSPLGDIAAVCFVEDAGSRLALDELRFLRSSTLENLDGSDPEIILAVEFDIVSAVQAAIARRTMQCTVDDVDNGKAAWSMGSDGGPLRRSAITFF